MTTKPAVHARSIRPKSSTSRATRKVAAATRRQAIDSVTREWLDVVCGRYFNPYDRLD